MICGTYEFFSEMIRYIDNIVEREKKSKWSANLGLCVNSE
jgi:hypothetical protein